MPSWSSPRPCGPISARAISNGQSPNIPRASAATGRALARVEQGGLRQRMISALVLATALVGAVMAWEWGRLCRGVSRRRFAPGAVEALVLAVVLAAIAVAAAAAMPTAFIVAAAGAGLVYAAARQRPGGQALWTALGTLWVTLPCLCFLWLAQSQAGGRALLIWLLAVVWATDIGAYAAGRSIGGPRLAPRLSPRKTWAGLAGGVLSAALAGGAAALLLAVPAPLLLVALSAGLAIVAQLGDLAESLAKRRFGVKDSSGLIPGHGGVLDRLDGLLAVVPAVALLTLASGRGVLAWH